MCGRAPWAATWAAWPWNPARTVDALEKEVAQNPSAPEPLLELTRLFVERAAEIQDIQSIPYYHRNTGEVAGQIKGEDPLQRAVEYPAW